MGDGERRTVGGQSPTPNSQSLTPNTQAQVQEQALAEPPARFPDLELRALEPAESHGAAPPGPFAGAAAPWVSSSRRSRANPSRSASIRPITRPYTL